MTNSTEPKRYYRSTDDKLIAGVCGGLAEYFGIDSTIVRLLAIILTLFTSGGGILAYIVLAVIVPKRPVADSKPAQGAEQGNENDAKKNDTGRSDSTLDKK